MNFYTNINSYVSPISYAMILAVDSRGGIGLNNDLPWKGLADNKSDMQWFREKTKGKIVVMGYNTWVSIGRKPLPGRVNVVISKKNADTVRDDINAFNTAWMQERKEGSPTTVILSPSPEAAVTALDAGIGTFHRGGEVMIMGGAKIYESFMPNISRIYLTTFDGEFEADTFVHLDLKDFDLIYRDKTKYLEPKFEIWDVTEEVAQRPDSEIIQISHGHKPAEGIIAEIAKEKENAENV